MKKRLNNKGFALVETLVCALFVVAIFVIIFENYLPIMAKYNRYEKYDDLDSKYLAFYVKTFIETDKASVINAVHDRVSGKLLYTFEACTPEKCGGSSNPVPEDIKEIDGEVGAFELCTMLSVENRQKCQHFVDEANIKRIYLIDYTTTTLKSVVKDPAESSKYPELANVSVPLQLYIDNIPTFAATGSDKAGFKRLIIEVKHEPSAALDESSTTASTYYSYSNIELRPAH